MENEGFSERSAGVQYTPAQRMPAVGKKLGTAASVRGSGEMQSLPVADRYTGGGKQSLKLW
jgi:hypothetical protein